MRTALSLAFLFLLSEYSFAVEKTHFRQIPFDIFMQDSVKPGTISLNIPVPQQYAPLDIEKAPSGYSYWMRKWNMKALIKRGGLPRKAGYMFGQVSTTVSYDSSKDIFIGFEDDDSKRVMEQAFSEVKVERYNNGMQPVLLIRFTGKSNKRHIYALYIATGISSNVVYIAYLPENRSTELGEQFLNTLRQSLLKI